MVTGNEAVEEEDEETSKDENSDEVETEDSFESAISGKSPPETRMPAFNINDPKVKQIVDYLKTLGVREGAKGGIINGTTLLPKTNFVGMLMYMTKNEPTLPAHKPVGLTQVMRAMSGNEKYLTVPFSERFREEMIDAHTKTRMQPERSGKPNQKAEGLTLRWQRLK